MIKLNLECGTDIRNGYTNITFNPAVLKQKTPDNAKITIANFRNLDQVAQNDSVDEILYNPPLNTLRAEEATKVFKHWHDKLKAGGLLITTFYDIRRIGKFANSGELSLMDIHNMILGINNNYHVVLDQNVVKLVGEEVGFKINIISAKDFVVYIEFVK